MTALPVLTVRNHQIYNINGCIYERFIRVGDKAINLEEFDLDDLLVEWTPVEDSGYIISQQREVLFVTECGTMENGHVWIHIQGQWVCIYSLLQEVHNGCRGEETCCSTCGQLWKLTPNHKGQCWPCIIIARTCILKDLCRRKSGLCNKSGNCRHCYIRSAAGYEKSLFWSASNIEQPCGVASGSNKSYLYDCSGCGHCITKNLTR